MKQDNYVNQKFKQFTITTHDHVSENKKKRTMVIDLTKNLRVCNAKLLTSGWKMYRVCIRYLFSKIPL